MCSSSRTLGDVCRALWIASWGATRLGTCGGTTDYVCLFSCENLEADQYFTGSGGVGQPFSCPVADCIVDCSPGYFLDGECEYFESGVCEPCPALGPNAYFVTECTTCTGDFEYMVGVCETACLDGFTRISDECVPCVDECDVGYFLYGECSTVGAPSCEECSNAPEEASYTSNGTRDGDDCEFLCPELFFFSEERLVCEACTTLSSCAVGEIIVGECSATADSPCVDCDNAADFSVYTTEGSCDYECLPEYYMLNFRCEPCTTVCSNGFYLSGECGGEQNYVCMPCANCEYGLFYSGPGAIINDNESCPTSECTLECEEGLLFACELRLFVGHYMLGVSADPCWLVLH